jgi:hypothetical protein
LDALVQAKELAKRETENPTGAASAAAAAANTAAAGSKEFELENIESFPQEKEVSEKIYNEISKRDGVLAKQYQKKYEEIVRIVNNNSGNEKLIGELWDKLRILNRHAISDVLRGNTAISDKIRARISSRFDSIIIKDPSRQQQSAVIDVM